MNTKRYIRFWYAVILVSAIIALMGCAPAREVVTEDYPAPDKMLFEENDTVIGYDTLFYWK
jgi:hypothetical protein